MPADGIYGIKAGEIYERRLFTLDQLAVLRKLWKVRSGIIQDEGKHKGVEVLLFTKKPEVL